MDWKKIAVFSFFYSLYLLMPDCINVIAPSVKGYIATIIYAELHYFALAAFVCALIELLFSRSSVVDNLLHCVLHIGVIAYSISSIVLSSFFNLQWNEITFQILRETNERECFGFISSYCTSWLFGLIAFSFFLLLVVEIIVFVKNDCLRKLKTGSKHKWLFRLSTLCIVIWTISLFPFYLNVDNVGKADRFFVRTGVWNLIRSYSQFSRNLLSFDECAKNQENIVVDSVTYESKNIILIIGESYIRHHSQLYGYYLETNPFLSKERNLFIFDDVISSFNCTSESFKNFLSLTNVDDTIAWYQAPLLPAIMKRAGYNVVFYSNQFFVEGFQGGAEASAGFMNIPNIASNLFCYRNSNRAEYDGELVDLYIRDREKVEREEKNLVIYHLFGQHYPAEIQYPGDFSYFENVDQHRPALTRQESVEVARYDNATRYNDYVVSKILDLWRDRDAIVIYFSDHGDEIHDFRNHIGRSYDFAKTGAKVIHCQFDIPFLVFCSDQYIELHPALVSQISKSVQRPFMTDDLPHLILELAGISTPWYKPERSLINAQYDISRKRRINDTNLFYEDSCVGEDKVFYLSHE